MNRILPLENEIDVQPVPPSTPSLLTQSAPSTIVHQLFGPLHYERNYAYPLIIWLHGPRDDERQIETVMPHVSLRNYVGVAPRATRPMPGNAPGYRWQQCEDHIAAAEHRVFECIELVGRRYHIAPDRIFLAGYQCGGTMALRIGLRNPHSFAGALSIGGRFPERNGPLINLHASRHVPMFLAHGLDSPAYPASRLCDELRLFHVAGLAPTLRLYPCGNEMTTQMLHDMNAWIMSQVTGEA